MAKQNSRFKVPNVVVPKQTPVKKHDDSDVFYSPITTTPPSELGTPRERGDSVRSSISTTQSCTTNNSGYTTDYSSSCDSFDRSTSSTYESSVSDSFASTSTSSERTSSDEQSSSCYANSSSDGSAANSEGSSTLYTTSTFDASSEYDSAAGVRDEGCYSTPSSGINYSTTDTD